MPSTTATLTRRFPAAKLAAVLALACATAPGAKGQTTYYWDSNGTTAGFGNTTGVWGTDTFWGTSAAGTGATANTTITSLDTVNFGTATLNYANGTIGVAAGGVTVGNIVIGGGQTTGITLGTTGNAVTIQNGITKNAGSGNFTFASPVVLAASQTWTNNTVPASATQETEQLRASAGINYGANTFTIAGQGVTGFSGGAITGSGNFIMNGTGSVVFNAGIQDNSATFTGKINLNAGVARYQNANNLGSGNIEINGGILEGRFGSNLTRTQGTGANQIQITGGVSGFSGQGAGGTGNSTFNIGDVTWGSSTFNPTEFVLQSATTNTGGLGTFSSNINLNGADRTIRSNQTSGVFGGGSGTFSGNITNSSMTVAGITKTGVGLHIFSGTNTYNGGTNISAGALLFNTRNSMPASGTVTVADGAILGVTVAGSGTTWGGGTGVAGIAGLTSTSNGGEGFGGQTGAVVNFNGNSFLALNVTLNVIESNALGDGTATSIGLIKLGNSTTLTLSGNNTYTGTTTLVAGALEAGSTNALSSGNIIFRGGTLRYTVASASTDWATRFANSTSAITLDTNGQNVTLAGTIGSTNTGGLTKTGNGTLTLSGTNSYSGATTLSGGTLSIAGSSSLPSGSAITWGTTDTTLRFENDSNVTVANTLNTSGRSLNRTLVVDRITSGAAVNLQFNSVPNLDCGTVFNFQAGPDITSGAPTITFLNGTGSSDSNNGTIAGGTGATGAIRFNPTGVNVVINGITSSGRTRGYILDGTSTGNRITGTWANGNGTEVLKTGTGTWTLAGTSQYTLSTTIANGTLKFEKQTALYNNTASSWTADNLRVNSGGTLAFNVGGTGEFTAGNVTTLLTNLASSTSSINGMNAGSRLGFDTSNAVGGTFTIADAIADTTGASGGARGLTKLGTGTLILTNSNGYTGATTVTAGTLLVNGSTAGGSAVTVNSGGTLGGTGTVGGPVTVEGGGTVAPGAGVGTLTVTNALTVQNLGKYQWELSGTPTGSASAVTAGQSDSGITRDLLAFTGVGNTLTMDNGSILAINYAGTLDNSKYYSFTVATSSGTPGIGSVTFDTSGSTAFTNYLAAGGLLTLSSSGGNVYLNAAPVPEPATVLGLAALGLGVVGGVRRWRGRKDPTGSRT